MYLNCHSYYSLRYGTISVEDLVAEASAMEIEALALTDINATTGVFDFISACEAKGIKPIIGIDFRVEEKGLFIALAQNREGFREMNEFLSAYNASKIPLPCIAPIFQNVYVIYPLDNVPEILSENEFIGIRIEDRSFLHQKKWHKWMHKWVILQSVSFRNEAEYQLHKILRAVEKNLILSRLEPNMYGRKNQYFISPKALINFFSAYPQIIANTYKLAEQCNFDFDFKTPKNKKFYTNSKYSDRLLLENLAWEGMEMRYGKHHQKAKERIIKELHVIDKLNFSGYFLITWDVIRYSKSRGFFHVGRGSGANSIISYCLGISNICPLELDLYFERFLNPSRSSPPDFDIDWSWKDRDTILDYIFKRFDTKHTCFTGTMGTFKYRSTLRELGKVFGLPKNEIDDLVHKPQLNGDKGNLINTIHKYGSMLEGFPNLRSLHACGIMISEEPLTYYTALDMPPKGFQTAQFDMYIAESIGFEKLDILSQRGIGHINDCVDLVKQNKNVEIDIHDVNRFKIDNKCNDLLKKGMALGCFYIESPAMRGLLIKLRCDNYLTLVAASSIIRPGVSKSGMMREYIMRHNDGKNISYLHPTFEQHLGETHGVMVYQEDVIKIAHHFAGIDLADADILRRAMSGKTRSKGEFERIKQLFFVQCKAKGYADELANEVYRQIESFAGYSFCKAHSASYAVESYQSLFLKAYYPLEFIVAVINNFGGFYRTEIYFHEARVLGANLFSPCVNSSEYYTSIAGNDIFVGFIHLQNLENSIAQQIPAERRRNGFFTSLEDFINRVEMGIETMQTLIFIGALRFTGKPKNQLLIEARMILGGMTKKAAPKKRNGMLNKDLLIFSNDETIFNTNLVIKMEQPKMEAGIQSVLFHEKPKAFKLPKMERNPLEDAFDEMEILGFPISFSPFDLLQTNFRGQLKVSELLQHVGKTVKMVGYLVTRKYVGTTKGLMNFGTWIADDGAFFDTVHFPDCMIKFPFQGAGCYLLLGKIVVDFEFPSIEIVKMAKLPYVPDPRY